MEEAINEFIAGNGIRLLDFLVDTVNSNCDADVEICFKSVYKRNYIPLLEASTNPRNANANLISRQISRAAVHISKCARFKRLKQEILLRIRKSTRFRYDSFGTDYSENSFAGTSTLGLDLEQSTRFPEDVDTNTLVQRLENAELSSEMRADLLSSLMSLSASTIGRRKYLTRILRICEVTVMEEASFTNTLLLFKKLFNTKDCDIVTDVFCCFVAILPNLLQSSLNENIKLKSVILLYKVNFFPMSKMITSLITYIGSVDTGHLSACNPMAILAALDPCASWMRIWAHTLSARIVIRKSLLNFAERIKTFLHEQASVDLSSYKCVFLHYSPKELFVLLNTNVISMLFIWMKYDDLYTVFTDQEWIKLVQVVVANQFDPRNNISSNKTIIKLFYEITACNRPAQFILTPTIARFLSNVHSVPAMRIQRIALQTIRYQPHSTTIALICKQIPRFLCSSSKTKRYEAILCIDSMIKRFGWDIVESEIDWELFSTRAVEHHQNRCLKEVVERIRAFHDLYVGESIRALFRNELTRNSTFSIPPHFIQIKNEERRLLLKKIMQLFEDNSEEFVEYEQQTKLKLSAHIAALLWQKQTGIEIVNELDWSFILQKTIQKAYELNDSSMLNALHIFTFNLDIAMQLRERAKFLRKLFQAIVRWKSKQIGVYFDAVSMKTLSLFASIIIGGPSEIIINSSLTSTPIKNPRSIIKMMYADYCTTANDKEGIPIRSVNEVVNIMERDGSYCASEMLTFLASTVTVDDGTLMARNCNVSDSQDESEMVY
ncbi:unnamed protein product [Anisakis simplex]|uniref:Uncharacterized protein n=1 Tax=Anisakis simplex TaxID=6269 RepID=A0A0M3JRD9_ANISI|nr:unnamed protein product [Anisakis simplex]